MNMRQQFVNTIEHTLDQDANLVLLLGDIGVFGFRKAFELFPERVYNIGILEQATVSLAAGFAKTGFIPVIHTIAPFLIERSLEQLKIDFCYQRLGGNFISVGASYDYAALGCTHHCPGDVGILKYLPGMELIVPGTSTEFDLLFQQTYANGNPTYYRLSERANHEGHAVKFGRAEIIKKGTRATVVAVGPALAPVLAACEDLDLSILYYTTVVPFDADTLREHCASSKIILCEPYYSGCLAADIMAALRPRPIVLDCIGVPHVLLTNYGRAEEHDEHIGFTAENIKARVVNFLNA